MEVFFLHHYQTSLGQMPKYKVLVFLKPPLTLLGLSTCPGGPTGPGGLKPLKSTAHFNALSTLAGALMFTGLGMADHSLLGLYVYKVRGVTRMKMMSKLC